MREQLVQQAHLLLRDLGLFFSLLLDFGYQSGRKLGLRHISVLLLKRTQRSLALAAKGFGRRLLLGLVCGLLGLFAVKRQSLLDLPRHVEARPHDLYFCDLAVVESLVRVLRRRQLGDARTVLLGNYLGPKSDRGLWHRVEELEAINNPEDPSAGTRIVPFSRIIYIEKDDFLENPPKKFYRLAPGREVRLRYGYFIKCTRVVKDSSGNIKELHCIYDPKTRGGNAPDGRKVKATLHWVSSVNAVEAEVRLYDHLFTIPDLSEIPENKDWKDYINPNSKEVLYPCMIEPNLTGVKPGFRFQFERLGYFCVDPDSTDERLILNRIVKLRDTWAKIQKKNNQTGKG